MKSKLLQVLLVAGVVVFAMIVFPVSSDAADCYHYEDSMEGYVFGYGTVCLSSGPGCGECVEGANSCTYDGPGGTCDPTPENRN